MKEEEEKENKMFLATTTSANQTQQQRKLLQTSSGPEDSHCWSSISWDTASNANEDSSSSSIGRATTSAMKFDIGSKVQPVHWQTLELSVEADSTMTMTKDDWRIQVYLSNATYIQEKRNQQNVKDDDDDSSWFTKIVDTTALVHPNGNRILIPMHAFGAASNGEATTAGGISLNRLDRRMVYIRAAGPWLSYTTKALQQFQDQAASNLYWTLFVGNPILSALEPDTNNDWEENNNNWISAILNPDSAMSSTGSVWDTSQSLTFSGIVHYQYQRSACSTENNKQDGDGDLSPFTRLTLLPVEYLFVVNQTLAATDYQRLGQAVDGWIDERLARENEQKEKDSTLLQQYVQLHQLKRSSRSKALKRNLAGQQCQVPGWTACHVMVVRMQVEYHDNEATDIEDGTDTNHSISQERVAAALYERDIVTDMSNQAIVPSLSTVGVLYMGLTTVQVRIHFTLHGVPAGTNKLDDTQVHFFTNQVLLHANVHLDSMVARVLDVHVDKQLAVAAQETSTTHNSFQLSGVLTAGHSVLYNVTDLADRMHQAFSSEQQDETTMSLGTRFVSFVTYNAHLQAPMAEHRRFDAFSHLESMDLFVEDRRIDKNANDKNNDSVSFSQEDNRLDDVTDSVDWWIFVLAGVGGLLVVAGTWWVVQSCWFRAPGKRTAATSSTPRQKESSSPKHEDWTRSAVPVQQHSNDLDRLIHYRNESNDNNQKAPPLRASSTAGTTTSSGTSGSSFHGFNYNDNSVEERQQLQEQPLNNRPTSRKETSRPQSVPRNTKGRPQQQQPQPNRSIGGGPFLLPPHDLGICRRSNRRRVGIPVVIMVALVAVVLIIMVVHKASLHDSTLYVE